jgi:hypothetical protein
MQKPRQRACGFLFDETHGQLKIPPICRSQREHCLFPIVFLDIHLVMIMDLVTGLAVALIHQGTDICTGIVLQSTSICVYPLSANYVHEMMRTAPNDTRRCQEERVGNIPTCMRSSFTFTSLIFALKIIN